MTHDDNNLISSDGTDTISFRDDKFAVVRTIKVTENGRAVRNINELEYLGPGTAFNPGSTPAIFANIWQTARLLRISTETGEVDGFLDLKSTWDQEMQQASVDVPNGIATDSQGRLWVTGKFWNNFYVLEPAASNSSSPTSSATSSSSVATTTAKPAAGGRLSARTGLLTGAGAIAMVAILML